VSGNEVVRIELLSERALGSQVASGNAANNLPKSGFPLGQVAVPGAPTLAAEDPRDMRSPVEGILRVLEPLADFRQVAFDIVGEVDLPKSFGKGDRRIDGRADAQLQSPQAAGHGLHCRTPELVQARILFVDFQKVLF
jgi:hypothetical protein